MEQRPDPRLGTQPDPRLDQRPVVTQQNSGMGGVGLAAIVLVLVALGGAAFYMYGNGTAVDNGSTASTTGTSAPATTEPAPAVEEPATTTPAPAVEAPAAPAPAGNGGSTTTTP